jgi:hypothetical protein
MIELILIIGLFGIGVFMVLLASDFLLNDVLCAIIGIIGGGIIIYALIWALRWFMLGGLLQ